MTAVGDRPDSLCEDAGFGSYSNQVPMIPPVRLGLRGPIGVDICIASEIAGLWARGIRTIASCCGHGQHAGTIAVDEVDHARMLALGYRWMTDHEAPAFATKTGCTPGEKG